MVNVLVVDDSSFFRRTISSFLESDPDISVIGQAHDGEEAVRMAGELKPDVITMDVEMPKMDGITAVKKIMAIRPTPILMFSNQTEKGAQTTLDALHAGAADFFLKNFQQVAVKQEEMIHKFQLRVKELALQNKISENFTEQLKQTIRSKSIKKNNDSLITISNYKLIAIGASTGGPVALEKVLTKLPASFPSPIILIQHMPAGFTKAFSERLNQLCKITVKEAEDDEPLLPGTAYLAPGGKQTYVVKQTNRILLKVKESAPDLNYQPCVDETFKSIAKVYSRGKLLAIIMTGMGSDGCEGVRQLKKQGATVWAQNQATSVVYGMPMAITNENLADKVLAVDDIGNKLAKTG